MPYRYLFILALALAPATVTGCLGRVVDDGGSANAEITGDQASSDGTSANAASGEDASPVPDTYYIQCDYPAAPPSYDTGSSARPTDAGALDAREVGADTHPAEADGGAAVDAPSSEI